MGPPRPLSSEGGARGLEMAHPARLEGWEVSQRANLSSRGERPRGTRPGTLFWWPWHPPDQRPSFLLRDYVMVSSLLSLSDPCVPSHAQDHPSVPFSLFPQLPQPSLWFHLSQAEAPDLGSSLLAGKQPLPWQILSLSLESRGHRPSS